MEIGVLEHVAVSDTYSRWELVTDYHKKKIILCVDGLSLDRHKHFQKKLLNVKTSFSNNFRQATIFKKALGCIIEISGPLHMSFHMLQTIFIIFNSL